MWEGKRIPVTTSLGVAHSQIGPPLTKAELLLEAADIALYAAKRSGRNRVEVATAPRVAPTSPPLPPVDKPPGSRKRTWDKPTAPAEVAQDTWQQMLKKSKKD
jgi:hypothetical protein